MRLTDVRLPMGEVLPTVHIKAYRYGAGVSKCFFAKLWAVGEVFQEGV